MIINGFLYDHTAQPRHSIHVQASYRFLCKHISACFAHLGQHYDVLHQERELLHEKLLVLQPFVYLVSEPAQVHLENKRDKFICWFING